jgi:DNA-binding transcriptional ArsR family regulator
LTIVSADVPPGRWRRALAHPERVRILRYLLAHEEVAASDLARLWNTDLSALSYHFRILAAAGIIECRRRSQRRGALKRHFSLRDRKVASAALSVRTCTYRSSEGSTRGLARRSGRPPRFAGSTCGSIGYEADESG